MLLETEFKFNIKSLILHRNKLFVVRIDIICIVIRKIGTIFWYSLWWGNWVTTISVQFRWWKMFCPSFLVSFLWRSFLKIILDLLALAEVNIQTYSSILSFSWLLCLISCMRYQQMLLPLRSFHFFGEKCWKKKRNRDQVYLHDLAENSSLDRRRFYAVKGQF